jgi:hypothetical protein
MEQAPLFAERLDVSSGMCFFGLEGHVGIYFLSVFSARLTMIVHTRDLWNWTEVVYDSEKEDKAGNGEVRPLHVLQCTLVGTSVLEEDI